MSKQSAAALLFGVCLGVHFGAAAEPIVDRCRYDLKVVNRPEVFVYIVGQKGDLIEFWTETLTEAQKLRADTLVLDGVVRDHTRGERNQLHCREVQYTHRYGAFARTGWKNSIYRLYGFVRDAEGKLQKITAANFVPGDGVVVFSSFAREPALGNRESVVLSFGRKGELSQRFCWNHDEQRWYKSIGRHQKTQPPECSDPMPARVLYEAKG